MGISNKIFNYLRRCRATFPFEIQRAGKVLSAAFFLFFSSYTYSQTSTTYSTAGSYTFTVPACVYTIEVECWGAGGGGGGNSSDDNGGGGGGGGAYSKKTISVTPGATYSVEVGAAGIAGISTPTDGGDGADSWFGNTTTVLAEGGYGGTNTLTDPAPGGLGGIAANGYGDTKFDGGAGGAGSGNGGWDYGGGGGSSGGNASAGNTGKSGYGNNTEGNGVYQTFPPGGAAPGGGYSGGYGGSEGNISGDPAAGTDGGGGGGGARNGNVSGAAGGAGRVYVNWGGTYYFNATSTWTCPTGINTVTVQCWGAGGGGGGGYSTQTGSDNSGGGAGGGGGEYAISVLSVVPGTTYTVTIGSGGAGGANDGGYSGSDGGDTWFSTSSTIFSNGGTGGGGSNNTSAADAAGVGGTGGIGTTTYDGGAGGPGCTTNYGVGGGGGASGGTGAAGGDGANAGCGGGSGAAGGAGGTATAGGSDGGDGGKDWSETPDAAYFGAGGGGGGERAPGGTGANGQILITYSEATITLSSANPASTADPGLCASSTDTEIYAFTILNSDPTESKDLTDLDFTTTGTYAAADITNFQLWFNDSDNLATATSISTISATLGTGSHTFAGLTQTLELNDVSYFWITVDVAASPTDAVTLGVSAIATGDLTLSGSCVDISGTAYASGTHNLSSSTVVASAEAAGQNTIEVDDVLTLTGAIVGGSATTGAWSVYSSSPSGTHTLSSTSQTATPEAVTFTPEASFTGTVTLRLTSDGCPETDDRTIIITENPVETWTTAGEFYWEAPCGVTSVTVQVWAAGGGGGGGDDCGGGSDAGSGGGGGGFSTSALAVTPGTTYTLTVGTGGTGGQGQSTEPTAGGNSWFSLNGSEPVSNATGTLAEGGAAGDTDAQNTTKASGGLAANGWGTTKYDGGSGGYSNGNVWGAGGGGGAGTDGAGGDGGNEGDEATGGTAGAGGGAGGRSSTGDTEDGQPGIAPGGGGGGTSDDCDVTGGAGGAGKIILTPGSMVHPTTTIGNDVHACYLSGATNITSGTSTSNSDTDTWTTLDGTGSFANATSTTTATYTPSTADRTLASITLLLSSTVSSACDSDAGIKTFYVYSDTSWIGSTNTDWATAGNWCSGVPSCSDDVLIPSEALNQPTINATGAAADNLTINSSATLTMATTNTLGICGNWTNNGTFVVASSDVHFKGTANQTIGGSSALTFYDLTMNNTGTSGTADDITLSQATTVTNVLTLTDGILNTDVTNLLDLTNTATTATTATNAGSFVDGPIKWSITTGGTYIFPTGDGSTSWARVALSSLSAAGVFTCEYTASSHSNVDASDVDDDTDSPYLNNVSAKEYWDVDRVSGGNAKVTLYWADSDFSDIDDCTSDNDLVVAHYTSSEWRNANTSGTSTATGTCSSSDGTITSDLMTSFSPFSFGSKSDGLNPLPIELLSFTVDYNGSSVDLNWITASETNNDYFTIERSIDGINFEIIEDYIASKATNGNSTSNLSYFTEDVLNETGVYYYRLKQTDFDGQYEYSNVRVVTIKGETDFIFTLAPNPSSGTNVSLFITTREFNTISVEVYDIIGQSLYQNEFDVESEDNNIYPLDFSRPLSSGVYVVMVTIDGFTVSRRMIVD